MALLDEKVVIEIGYTRASAYAGRLLADANAHVIVIDDAFRREQLAASARVYLDAGKSLARWEPGDDPLITAELLPHADLLVTDLTAEELRARGIDWDSLQAAKPSLSCIRLSAVGWDAPGQSGPSGELSMQAISGLMHMVGSPDREPLSLPFGIGSLQLGLHGAAAAGVALYSAGLSGQGRVIDIAGADVLASYVRIYGAVASYYGIPLKRDGRRAPGSGGRYPFGLFPCKDGYVAMICRSEREWASLLDMMGNPEWSTRERYRDLYAIAIKYPDEVDELIAPWLMEHTRDDLLVLAHEHQIPVAPVRTIGEVAEDPQLRDHRRYFDNYTTIDGRAISMPGRPWLSEERSLNEPVSRPLAEVAADTNERSTHGQR